MASAPDRINQLARRVRWLDSYRRLISVLIAGAFCIACSRELSYLFGSEWSGGITIAISIFFATIVWWVVEVMFAWLTALWETEYVHLLRDRGLPIARLLQRPSRRER